MLGPVLEAKTVLICANIPKIKSQLCTSIRQFILTCREKIRLLWQYERCGILLHHLQTWLLGLAAWITRTWISVAPVPCYSKAVPWEEQPTSPAQICLGMPIGAHRSWLTQPFILLHGSRRTTSSPLSSECDKNDFNFCLFAKFFEFCYDPTL